MIGEKIMTHRGLAQVVAMEHGVPVIEQYELPGLSDAEQMGQLALSIIELDEQE